MGNILKALVALVVFVVAFRTCTAVDRPTPPPAAAAAAASATAAADHRTTAPNPASATVSAEQVDSWDYVKQTDAMTGKDTNWANLTSRNSLSLGFPYSGPNFGRLTVRKSPRFGTDVILQIEKGQFICGVDGCAVSIRFDEGKPQRFAATEPADHNTTSLFLDNAQRFIDQAKKAKVIRVAAVLYQEGEPVLEFKVGEPLKWPPK